MEEWKRMERDEAKTHKQLRVKEDTKRETDQESRRKRGRWCSLSFKQS